MKLLKSLFAIAATAALVASAAPAVAQIYLTEDEVLELTLTTQSFEGVLDGLKQGEVVRVTVAGANDISYEYVSTGESFRITDRLSRAGGSPNGNPTLNFREPDGDEVRLEWIDGTRTIQFEFWRPGQRAGQIRNNPAEAKAELTPVTDPLAEGEVPVTEERRAARAEVSQFIAPGTYGWSASYWSGSYSLTVNADGSFSEIRPDGTPGNNGFMIVDGSEVCFDVVNGNCYDVSGPDAAGQYTLTAEAKKLQSSSTNPNAGAACIFT